MLLKSIVMWQIPFRLLRLVASICRLFARGWVPVGRESIKRSQQARPHSTWEKSKNPAPQDCADWNLVSFHQVSAQLDVYCRLRIDLKTQEDLTVWLADYALVFRSTGCFFDTSRSEVADNRSWGNTETLTFSWASFNNSPEWVWRSSMVHLHLQYAFGFYRKHTFYELRLWTSTFFGHMIRNRNIRDWANARTNVW